MPVPSAAVLAPALEEELAAVAPGAVLPELVGPKVAVLARRGGRVVGGALAAVGDVLALDPAGSARERRRAVALKAADAERGRAGRERLNAGVVEQVEAVAADPANVAGGGAVAVVAVVVETPVAESGLRAGLDAAALAGDGGVATPELGHPVVVAHGAAAVGAAGAAAVLHAATVAWTRQVRRSRTGRRRGGRGGRGSWIWAVGGALARNGRRAAGAAVRRQGRALVDCVRGRVGRKPVRSAATTTSSEPVMRADCEVKSVLVVASILGGLAAVLVPVGADIRCRQLKTVAALMSELAGRVPSQIFDAANR